MLCERHRWVTSLILILILLEPCHIRDCVVCSYANSPFIQTACIMGACVICVDLLIRYIPGKADFRIQDSSSFLACSLSLSFGVMVSGHVAISALPPTPFVAQCPV